MQTVFPSTDDIVLLLIFQFSTCIMFESLLLYFNVLKFCKIAHNDYRYLHMKNKPITLTFLKRCDFYFIYLLFFSNCVSNTDLVLSGCHPLNVRFDWTCTNPAFHLKKATKPSWKRHIRLKCRRAMSVHVMVGLLVKADNPAWCYYSKRGLSQLTGTSY